MPTTHPDASSSGDRSTSSSSADQPYCSRCGYDLTNLTESSRCPECGGALVEVLARRGQAWRQGKRYRSAVRLFGLPAIDIASGSHGDEPKGRPRGFLAIGEEPVGVVAIGGFARGLIAIGGTSIGGITFGGLSIGLVSAGGMALGGLAAGGGAIGGIATGGGAVGGIASGGGVIGYIARGGGVIGHHIIAPGIADPTAQRVFLALDWLIGNPMGGMFPAMYTMGLIISLIVLLGGGLALFAWTRHRAAGSPMETRSP